jgi:hypothetical protein
MNKDNSPYLKLPILGQLLTLFPKCFAPLNNRIHIPVKASHPFRFKVSHFFDASWCSFIVHQRLRLTSTARKKWRFFVFQ